MENLEKVTLICNYGALPARFRKIVLPAKIMRVIGYRNINIQTSRIENLEAIAANYLLTDPRYCSYFTIEQKEIETNEPNTDSADSDGQEKEAKSQEAKAKKEPVQPAEKPTNKAAQEKPKRKRKPRAKKKPASKPESK